MCYNLKAIILYIFKTITYKRKNDNILSSKIKLMLLASNSFFTFVTPSLALALFRYLSGFLAI